MKLGNVFKANPNKKAIAILKRLYHDKPAIQSCAELTTLVKSLKAEMNRVQENPGTSRSEFEKMLSKELNTNIDNLEGFVAKILVSLLQKYECVYRQTNQPASVFKTPSHFIDFKSELDQIMKEFANMANNQVSSCEELKKIGEGARRHMNEYEREHVRDLVAARIERDIGEEYELQDTETWYRINEQRLCDNTM